MIRFGKYLLERQLAIGGMAELFLARQQGPAGFEKQLVIKRILPHFANDEQFIQMFLDEARTAAKLNHPNVVQIFELGEIEGSYYIAMELIRGESLAKVIRRLRQHGMHMPLHLAAKVVASVCAGLDYAHNFAGGDGIALGLVHRDISPDNVLVSFDGAVKMIDFGIAKARDNETKTQAGSVKGKFCYMSPEQVQGKRLDRRSDIFSLGIVLHELTTLEKPFGAEADLMTVSAIVNDAPKSALDLVEGYPAPLWEIIAKALTKNRDQRYDSAHAMQIALERFIHSRGEFLSDRDIGGYLKKLFSDDNVAIDELREMASGIRSRVIVAAKTTVGESLPEEATAIGDAPKVAQSEAATQAVEQFDEEAFAKAAMPRRAASIPPPKRAPSIPPIGIREPSTPGTPLLVTSVAPVQKKSGVLGYILGVLLLGGLGAGGWFGWQWYQAQQAAPVAVPPAAPSDPIPTADGGGDGGTPPVIAAAPDVVTIAAEAPDAGSAPDSGAPDVAGTAPETGPPDVGATPDTGATSDVNAVDASPEAADTGVPAANAAADVEVAGPADAGSAVAPEDTAVAVAAPEDVGVAAMDVAAPADAGPAPAADVAAPEVPTDAGAATNAGQGGAPDAGPAPTPDIAAPPVVLDPAGLPTMGELVIQAPPGTQILVNEAPSGHKRRLPFGTYRVKFITTGVNGGTSVKSVTLSRAHPKVTVRP